VCLALLEFSKRQHSYYLLVSRSEKEEEEKIDLIGIVVIVSASVLLLVLTLTSRCCHRPSASSSLKQKSSTTTFFYTGTPTGCSLFRSLVGSVSQSEERRVLGGSSMWYCLSGSESSSDLSDIQENVAQTSDKDTIALHKYIDDPDLLPIDAARPPVILPKKGFRVELGGSLTEKDVLPNVKLEKQEKNSLYFREHFFGKKHANYVGGDRNTPVVVSITLENQVNGCNRAIVRTKQDDYFLFIQDSFFRIRMIRSLAHSLPNVFAHVKLKEVREDNLSRKLLHMEDRLLVKSYKFGVLYCKEGQTNEDDMFSNCEESEQFKEFLGLLGDKVPLKGYTGFRGGLDVESDTTGTHSVVSKFHTFEIMFHVSTLLPFTQANSQQVTVVN